MKNKILILALLVVFVSVSFIACGGDSPKKVKEITVTPVNSGYYEGWILTWDAVGKNVVDYQVVGKIKDKSTIIYIGYADNKSVYPTGLPNSDADKWYGYVPKEGHGISGDYYFGVRTIAGTTMFPDDTSNIRWTKDTYKLEK